MPLAATHARLATPVMLLLFSVHSHMVLAGCRCMGLYCRHAANSAGFNTAGIARLPLATVIVIAGCEGSALLPGSWLLATGHPNPNQNERTNERTETNERTKLETNRTETNLQ